MSKKLLNEKGAVKVWVIVLVIVLCLVVAGGIFAYVKISGDKKDDEETTSQSKEKNDKKNVVEDDEEEEENTVSNKSSKNSTSKKSKSGERHFVGTVDSDVLGVDGIEWTVDVYGDDDSLSEMVMVFDMEKFLKDAYKDVEDEYDYDEFIETMQSTMEESMDGFEDYFTEDLGDVDVKANIKWTSDEVLEISIDFSNVDFDDIDLDIEEGESVIESFVEALEDEGVEFKEV